RDAVARRDALDRVALDDRVQEAALAVRAGVEAREAIAAEEQRLSDDDQRGVSQPGIQGLDDAKVEVEAAEDAVHGVAPLHDVAGAGRVVRRARPQGTQRVAALER